MMDAIRASLLETFRDETRELLAELEAALLELEAEPSEAEVIGRVFRALHTIKGNGAMFGYEVISTFTHDIENVYEKVREGTLSVSRDLIDLTLAARDVIAALMADPEASSPELAREKENLQAAFGSFLRGDEINGGTQGKITRIMGKPRAEMETEKTYRVRFRPEADLFLTGTNPLVLLSELASLGQVLIVPNVKEIPRLEDYDPEMCYLSWDIILTTDRGLNAIRDVFIFVEGRCRLDVDVIHEKGSQDSDEEHSRLGEILVERGDIDRETLEGILKERTPIGQELVERSLVDSSLVESALLEQKVLRDVRQRREEDPSKSVRVASDKLDSLVDLVGELVTVQARLSETAASLGDPQLFGIAEQVEHLTWELRDNAFAIRMIPIGTTFSTFRRLVRDLSREMGREVDLLTEGAETELDKTVIEKLKDPLVHIIRNAIDHGIEPPETRESKGKRRVGKIFLSASQAGADVMIRISDDGRGLDEKAIRAKAVERGIISPDASLKGRELFNVVLQPGFSTAGKITEVSGRGVGMDIVKRAVDALRGSMEIESEPDVGTAISIRLPLTLAIIEGLQVNVKSEKFIFPLSLVEEVVELRSSDRNGNGKSRLANVRGELVPYIVLREIFQIPGDAPAIEQIVITGRDKTRVGFVVDLVVGEHQTVIKSLGRVYQGARGVSSASILGDGSIALILDIGQLVRMATEEG